MANNRELSQFASTVGYNGGNIGIGTDSMTSALQIYAADTGEGTAKGQITLKDTAAYNQTPTGGIVFQGHHTAGAQAIFAGIRGFKANTGNGDYDGCLAFDVRKHGAVAYEAMRINEDGNIGVGTDDPSSLIHGQVSSGSAILTLKSTATSGEASVSLSGKNSSGTVRTGIFKYDNSDMFRIGTTASIPIRFETNDTERLRIDSSGRLLVGLTSFPDTDTFVVRGGAGEDNEAFMSLMRGSAPANNQNLGMLRFHGNGNQTESGRITCLRDGGTWTAGSSHPGRLTFSTTENGASSPTERMRITHDGRLHIGDSLGTNHSGMFQVIHEGGGNQTNDCLSYFETNANDWCIITNSNEGGSANHYHIYFMEEGSTRGQIAGSHGSNVNYTQGSDYRWKENIIDLTGTEGIDICKRLRPRKYNWIKNREGTGQINTVDGFIAHEVQEAGVLGAVIGEKDAVNEDGSIDGQMLDYGQMTPVLAAAIKGLIAKVETLETQNTDLLARVTALEGS